MPLRRAQVQRQPSPGGAGIHRLGDAHELYALHIEQGNKIAAQIEQAATEAVDPMCHDHVNLSLAYVIEQCSKGGSLQSAATHTLVVVGGLNRGPTEAALAGDVGQAGLDLDLDRSHLAAMCVGDRNPCIDGAALGLLGKTLMRRNRWSLHRLNHPRGRFSGESSLANLDATCT